MWKQFIIAALLYAGVFTIAPQAAAQLSSETFVHFYGNLNNTFHQVRNKKEVTVAFLGGSITENPGWRTKTAEYLEQTYPQVTFNFIHAGISSLGSVPHSFRLQRDVLDKGTPDLLFVETAVNDLANKTPAAYQRKALEGIIQHALTANPYMNIVLMAFVDEHKIADYDAGRVPAEVALHDRLARHYKLPFINLAKEVQARIANREFTWKDDFKDLHPAPFGQEIYFNTIRTLFRKGDSSYTGQALTKPAIPAPGVRGIYDKGAYVNVAEAQRLQQFSVISNWKPTDGLGTRTGFVDVPVLEGLQPGASFRFAFNGTAVGIAIVSGADAGKIRYSVDGKTPKITDLYTQWSSALHLPWYLVLCDELKQGKHELKVEILTDKNTASKGNACRIVYFLVNQ
ncbi:MAG: GDSL-type esterase/lipase family protein [Agriterribacter sp.]